MFFEWDDAKNERNVRRHGIDFDTALLVFDDENRLDLYDEPHSLYEDRYIVIGRIQNTLVVLFVSYTLRGETIRIISARKANEREEAIYYGA